MLREVFEKGKELADKVTNVVMNYTEVEAKVRAATNDDPWGPHGQDMQEIAEYTKRYDTLSQVMGMLWRRMFQEHKSNWRRTYKSLLLLAYLLRNGSDRIVMSCKEHMYDLRLLESYQYIDENGKDQGVNIRHKAKDLLALLENESQLSLERKKAAQNRNKYQGGISGSINGHRHWNSDTGSRYDADSRDFSDDNRDFSEKKPQPYKSTNGAAIKSSEDTYVKPKALPKPANTFTEPVADLLDLDVGSQDSSQPPILQPPSLSNTFDPFNLSAETNVIKTLPIPSQPTSPVYINNNRFSDEFDNFVSAPLPTSSSSRLDDFDLIFSGTYNHIDPQQQLTQPPAVATVTSTTVVSQDKTPKIGSTWSNVGSIDISLDYLGNRKKHNTPTMSTSTSLNQLQQQFSSNKPGSAQHISRSGSNSTVVNHITPQQNQSNPVSNKGLNQPFTNNQFAPFGDLLH